MNSKIKNEATDNLFKCILTMKNLDECYRLFEDLCTVYEIQAIAQRMQVAEMLDRKCTYIEIAEKTGASTATISRVNRALPMEWMGISSPLTDCAPRKKRKENNDR